MGTGDLEKVMATAVGKKADYADVYSEYRRNEGMSLEEGLVKNCAQSTANGVGVRVMAEAKTGYAYTDDITIENLELAARTARYIAQNRESQLPIPMGQQKGEAHDLYPTKTPVTDVPLEKKVSLLYEIDEFARSEEHTSELQSRLHLVCRLLLEKKKKQTYRHTLDTQTL